MTHTTHPFLRLARRIVVLVALVTGFAAPTLGVGPTAAAQTSSGDQVARGLFDEGVRAFSEARYETALERFRAAYELSHRAGLLYNIGLTEDRLRNDEAALAAFEQFLRDAPPDEGRRGEVERRIIILRETIAEREAIEAERAAAAEAARQAQDEARIAQLDRERHAAALAAREAEDDQATPVYKRWWLWAIIGGAVAGGVTAGVVMSGDTPPPRYYASDTGGVIFAIRTR